MELEDGTYTVLAAELKQAARRGERHHEALREFAERTDPSAARK
jgi:hypothetical protein